jgi:hypothetical protein
MRAERTILFALAVVAAAGTARAQPAVEWAGYAKNLAVRSRSVLDGDAFLLDMTRFRIQPSILHGRWHAEAWVDTELLAGSWFETPEAAFADAVTTEPFVDLDWNVASGSRFRLDQKVFRATVAWHGDRAAVTAGRQRVSWGTGFVWTPTDVLHPIEPAAIERDEKPAVDAVQVVVPTGPLTGVEAVFAPGRRAGRHRVAGRFRGHVGEYDWTLMGGRFEDRWIVGGDFAGYVVDGGLRGEAAFTRSPSGDWSVRATANGDYTFSGGFYAFLEAHYNGAGAWDRADYDRIALVRGGILNLGRLYAATGITYLWTPLVTATLYVVQNLGDGSSLIGPGLSWSALQNAEVAAGVYIFRGPATSEYGAYRDAAFVSLQFFF